MILFSNTNLSSFFQNFSLGCSKFRVNLDLAYRCHRVHLNMISFVSLTHDSAPKTVDSFIEYHKAHINNMASIMKFDREHACISLERIHGLEFPNEQITLVSGTDGKR